MALKYTVMLLEDLPVRLWMPLSPTNVPWKTKAQLSQALSTCPLPDILTTLSAPGNTYQLALGQAVRKGKPWDGSLSVQLARPPFDKAFYNKQTNGEFAWAPLGDSKLPPAQSPQVASPTLAAVLAPLGTLAVPSQPQLPVPSSPSPLAQPDKSEDIMALLKSMHNDFLQMSAFLYYNESPKDPKAESVDPIMSSEAEEELDNFLDKPKPKSKERPRPYRNPAVKRRLVDSDAEEQPSSKKSKK